MKRGIFLLLIALFLTGCNMPSQTKTEPSNTPDIVATEVSRLQTEMPSPTQPPTQTPEPPSTVTPPPPDTATVAPSPTTSAATSTSIPGDPAAALGSPSWQDNLDSTKNFYLFENDNTTVEAGSGSLRLVGKSNIGWHGWSLTYAQNLANFYLEGTFITGTCSGADLYGLVFRASKENAGYFFGVTCDGQYGLRARDFNNNIDTQLIALKSNAAILTGSGQVNRLGIKAEGNKIALYANGALLEEITNDTFAAGYFGPFIASFSSGFSFDLDRIAVWRLN